jgi:tRNA 2-thiouridine synthesizing protein E
VALEDAMTAMHGLAIQARGLQAPALQFDEEGFMVDACAWTREAARSMAELDGVGPLTPDHWGVLLSLRFQHLVNCTVRASRPACDLTEALKARMVDLFGGCREAWRIAGLPHPGEQALADFD